MNMHYQRGLTLLEIMIAVAILIIVSTVAIPVYRGYVAESEFGSAQKDIRQAELILNDMALDNDLGSLDGGDTTERGLFLDANGLLMFDDPAACPPPTPTPPPPVPWCDPWGNIFRYQRADAATQDYVLFSWGPDGTASTADDVTR